MSTEISTEISTEVSKHPTEGLKQTLKEVERLFKDYSLHLQINQEDILDTLLERPEKYLDGFIKLANAIITAHKSEEKVSVNINNDHYHAFFQETRKLSALIDDGSHRLFKSAEGIYELEKL